MLELDERKNQLNNIQMILDDALKNKDVIRNIGMVYDYKLPDGSIDTLLSYAGNYNAVLSMFERQRTQEIVRATMRAAGIRDEQDN
jgi:hypothetical protein